MVKNTLPGLKKTRIKDDKDLKKLIDLLHRYCDSRLTVTDERGIKYVITKEGGYNA